MRTIRLYDTTLRDGSQGEDVAFTVEDKIRVSHKLDELGVHYIEGGWPGSNPRDVEFFKKIKHSKFNQARLTAFGSTRHPNNKAEDDPNLKFLLDSETEAVTIFGKIWDLHVREALTTTLDENLSMVFDSIAFLKKQGRETLFDAEHFFDGYKSNPEYALKVIKVAEEAGADWIVLCETNGGTMPWEVQSIVETVKQHCKAPLGIHTHNDAEVGVANAITAVRGGVDQVQGTINGIGERCGNANLVSIIPNLKLKMGFDCIEPEQLRRLKEVSAFVDEIANKTHWAHQPYVGKSAFAHKGGIHVNAIKKNRETYEHIHPEDVGNVQRILVSDLSGKSSILHKAEEYKLELNGDNPKVKHILEVLKESESLGFQYEGAEASFELLMRDALGEKGDFFDFVGYRVIVEKRSEDEQPISEATVKVRVNGTQEVTAAEGTGPVDALDQAIRKALGKFYPDLENLVLRDYKVRILGEKKGTSAKIRVLVESGDHQSNWGTVGVSENIIEASWQALIESIEYKLNAFSKAREPV